MPYHITGEEWNDAPSQEIEVRQCSRCNFWFRTSPDREAHNGMAICNGRCALLGDMGYFKLRRSNSPMCKAGLIISRQKRQIEHRYSAEERVKELNHKVFILEERIRHLEDELATVRAMRDLVDPELYKGF